MNQSELKQKYITRDRAVRILSLDGKIRAVAVKNTNTAITAQTAHELPPAPALLLAKQLAAATLMSAFLKGEERIILESDSNGPIFRLYAEAIQVGEVRGYARWNESSDMNASSEFDNMLGEGLYKVQRILYNRTEPVSSVIPIQNGNIESELVYYYMMSEQIPTIAQLDAVLDENGNMINSGGVIVQAMPGATEKDFELVYDSLSKASKISDYLASSLSPEDVLKEILPFDFQTVKSTQIDFFCRCSKDRFIDRLLTLDYDEIKSMRTEGTSELVCHYCNKKYQLTENDFDNLLSTIKAKTN